MVRLVPKTIKAFSAPIIPSRDRRFWVFYLLFCTIFFAIVTGGVVFAWTKGGYDPIASALQNSHGGTLQTVYYFRTDLGTFVHAEGRTLPLHASMLPAPEIGTCYFISIDVSILPPANVSIVNGTAPAEDCGLPYGR